MTAETLVSKTRKQLAELAKSRRVAGWHGMRKDELVEALVDVHRSRDEKKEPPKAQQSKPARPQTPPVTRATRTGRTRVSSDALPARTTVRRDISTIPDGMQETEELTVVAHDPNWLHARWALKRSTVQRAVTALGYDWHAAKPVIRVYRVEVDEVRAAKSRKLRDVEIHGDVDHWFVPVEKAPAHFRLEIGYVTAGGRFFALAKSKRVTTPRPGSRGAERPQWNVAKKTRHDGGLPWEPGSDAGGSTSRIAFALSSSGTDTTGEISLEVSTDVLLTGSVAAGSQLTVLGDAVRVGPDGRFSTRVTLEDGRLVIPAVAVSPDGGRQRTMVIAFERNTKELEPQNIGQLD
ncbi:MAG: DUF4912 domain-containing protein [Planctomycetota bacterium]